MFSRWDLHYYADPAQPLTTTAGEELDETDHHLPDLSEVFLFVIRRVQR